jgi:hypothetical protein
MPGVDGAGMRLSQIAFTKAAIFLRRENCAVKSPLPQYRAELPTHDPRIDRVQTSFQ